MSERKPIPYGRQSINEDDVAAVIRALRSDFLTTGPEIERFEKAVADYCGVQYAVAVANATAGLHLACQALDLGRGDFLWTSPNTFVASANGAEHCGARADFCDIDPITLNISADELEKKLKATPIEKHPKIVVPVHFAGQPCEMEKFDRLAKAYNFSVVEDAAHAIGAEYRGEKTGNCRYSKMTVFSFHPVKNITTGEGGLITTNDEGLFRRLKRIRSIGVTRDPQDMTRAPEGPWYYEQTEIGYNYRMTDLEAALGSSQIKRLDAFIGRRNELSCRYNEKLTGLPLRLPTILPTNKSACHLYVVQTLKSSPIDRRTLFNSLRESGILVNVHYIPIHLQPVYRQYGFKEGDFPKAEEYYRNAISLPIHYELTDKDQDYIVETIRRLLGD